MQPRLSAPKAVGCCHQRTSQGIDIGVWSVEFHARGYLYMVVLGSLEELCEAFLSVSRGLPILYHDI